MKIPNMKNNPKDGNFFRGIADHFQLIWRLWKDPRVNPLLKLLPFGALIYMISPLDAVIPAVDDVGVIWFFSYLFIELAPEEIVEEHRRDLMQTYHAQWKDGNETEISEDDVQEAEFTERR